MEAQRPDDPFAAFEIGGGPDAVAQVLAALHRLRTSGDFHRIVLDAFARWPALVRRRRFHDITLALIDADAAFPELWALLLAPRDDEDERDRAVRLEAILKACHTRRRLPKGVTLPQLDGVLAKLAPSGFVKLVLRHWLVLAEGILANADKIEAQLRELVQHFPGIWKAAAMAAWLCHMQGRAAQVPGDRFRVRADALGDVIRLAINSRVTDRSTLDWIVSAITPDDVDPHINVIESFIAIWSVPPIRARTSSRCWPS